MPHNALGGGCRKCGFGFFSRVQPLPQKAGYGWAVGVDLILRAGAFQRLIVPAESLREGS